MYQVKKSAKYEAIEVNTVERSIHLIPKYGTRVDTKMADGNSKPALDIWDEFWINNHSDPHIYNLIY